MISWNEGKRLVPLYAERIFLGEESFIYTSCVTVNERSGIAWLGLGN